MALVDAAIAAVKEASLIPAITGGRISRGSNHLLIRSEWSQRHLESGQSTKFTRNHVLSPQLQVIHAGSHQIANKDCKLSRVSNCGTYEALLISTKDDKSKENWSMEIWNSVQRLHMWDLTARNMHGPVYTDGEFGSFEWNRSGSHILYIAERKYPENQPLFKQQPEKGEDDKPKERGNDHLYRDDWGEQMTGKSESVVAILTLNTGDLHLLSQIPISWCPGQVIWRGDDDVVGCCWRNTPYRLGKIYCNRESVLFTANTTGKFQIVSEEGRYIYSPRLLQDDASVIYLDNRAGGPHKKTSRIISYNVITNKRDVLVDIVSRPLESGFHGVYTWQLQQRSITNSNYLVFSSIKQQDNKPYILNTDSGELLEIPCEHSNDVLDVDGDVILINHSAINSPPQLMVCKLPAVISAETLKHLQWISLDDMSTPDHLKNCTVDILPLCNPMQGQDKSQGDVMFNAMLVQPQGVETSALVVFPHGGPHSAFTTAYNNHISAFLKAGFSVLMVNYRGSLGQGEESINSLPGHVGDQDVSDVTHAVHAAEEKMGCQPKKVLYGGSHGGFLVTHLIGQHPDSYMACAARNPVTNIAIMSAVSDIPDWCMVEATGCDFEFTKLTDGELLTKYYNCSPIAHINSIKTPVLLLVGDEDRRVPPSQSYSFSKELTARGVKNKVLHYADCHPLSKVDVEADLLVNTLVWFMEHRSEGFA